MKYTIAILLTALFTFTVQAQQQLQLIDVSLEIDGTSNIHDWTSVAETVTINGTYSQTEGKMTIPTLRVKIPVESIKSSKGRIMDNKTYDALQSEQHPAITFTLKELSEINAASVKAVGTLTIAGKAKTISLTADRQLDGKGVLTFSGKKALKMTDFGIDPPTALLGTLKTGDDVTISYRLRFQVDATTADRN